jgi:homoserine O-acetyltransferase
MLVLAKMWQNADVGSLTSHGDYRRALQSVTARVLVMAARTDMYFDVKDGEEEVKYLKNGIFAPIPLSGGILEVREQMRLTQNGCMGR